MNQIVLDSLRALVSDRLGLHIREIDLPEFHQKLQQRLSANKMQQFEDYYRLLNSPAGKSEWKSLIPLLTTGETYFFRDKGQIHLLKQHILPELIEQRRHDHQARRIGKPSLRIWSAGCSCGEEPYTLSMLLTQLIPDIQNWDILVLGTDLNPESITKAKRGLYRQWSFRQVEPAVVTQYFTNKGTCWEVKPAIRRLVQLQTGNLVADDFSAPYSVTRDMDLIICRNVFIYFQPDTIAKIVDKFHAVLRTGGFFLSGHTELQGQDLSKFSTLHFDSSVAYQKANIAKSQRATPFKKSHFQSTISPQNRGRQEQVSQLSSTNLAASLNTALGALASLQPNRDNSTQLQPTPLAPKPSLPGQSVSKLNPSTPLKSPNQPPSLARMAATPSQSHIVRAQQAYDSKNYDRAIQVASDIIQSEPRNFDALHLLATAYSDRGEFQRALQYAQQALDVNPTSVETLYLMACVAEIQGDLRKAKQLLKQVMYLAPNSVSAYLVLGDIYHQEGDRQRADKMRQQAVNLLEQLSPDELVEHQGETAAAASLLSQIQAA